MYATIAHNDYSFVSNISDQTMCVGQWFACGRRRQNIRISFIVFEWKWGQQQDIERLAMGDASPFGRLKSWSKEFQRGQCLLLDAHKRLSYVYPNIHALLPLNTAPLLSSTIVKYISQDRERCYAMDHFNSSTSFRKNEYIFGKIVSRSALAARKYFPIICRKYLNFLI